MIPYPSVLPQREHFIATVARLCLPLAVLFALAVFSCGVSAQSLGEFPLTDFTKSSVDRSEIMSGGPPRDGIPPIDSPKFVSSEAAQEWLQADEPVVSFVYQGDARAYPLQIMTYHEIVNDTVGDLPVAVTFCPLCNASIVFDRRLDDTVLDFGTTGRLRKSDLIMYDRQTETWWQQFVGKGIVGEHTDRQLTQIASQIVSFETFRNAFPEGKILSKDTGFVRPYGNNPYAGYDSIDSSPFLYQGDIDPRLPPMERVLSIPTEKEHTLIPLRLLDTEPLINMQLGEKSVVVFAPSKANSALDQSKIAASRLIPSAAAFEAHHDGKTLTFEMRDDSVVDKETGSTWNAFGQALEGKLAGQRLRQIDAGVHFAFAWLAFDPKANIYRQ